MSNLVKKIRTDAGDLQIDYNALANLPALNTMFSNPNLLINGDFQINQYNVLTSTPTVFANGKYIIDRWQTASSNQQYSIHEENNMKYMRITAANNSISMLLIRQYVEATNSLKNAMKNNSMTISMKVRANKKSAYHYSTNAIKEVGTDWSIITCNYSYEEYFDNSKNALKVYAGIKPIDILTNTTATFATGDYVDIAWVKLEFGSVATRFSPRLVSEELLLCQRYYNYTNCRMLMTVYKADIADGTYYHPVTMRVNPTVTVHSIKYYEVDKQQFIEPASFVKSDKYFDDQYTMFVLTKNASDTMVIGNCTNAWIDVTFDAEIY